MLTKEQQKYFFELFKNAFYLDEKLTIETIYKKIEDPEVREIRNKLLVKAEKKAIRYAKKAVSKIKRRNFDTLLKDVLQSEGSNSDKFGEELLDEIEDDLKKN